MNQNIAGITLFVIAILLFSCTQEKKSSDEIVSSTITNDDGQTLKQTFNNTKGTLELEFEGQKILLNKVQTGSGVMCTNEHYEYNNWHGETTLKKDSLVIFYHKE